MRFARSGSGLAALALLLALESGCAPPGEPVARLSVEPDSLALSYPEFGFLDLHFEVLAPLAGIVGDPRVFLHLLDQSGAVVRTFDHPLPEPWVPGSEIAYRIAIYQSATAPALRPGSYTLSAGLYDSIGSRWPLETGKEPIAREEYEVAEVVAMAEGTHPGFLFPETWVGVESGTDRQILGRRWLREDGALRVVDLGAGGRLWLVVGIPEVNPEEQERVFDEGAAAPAVEVSASCSASGAELEGAGSHSLELVLVPGSGAEAGASAAEGAGGEATEGDVEGSAGEITAAEIDAAEPAAALQPGECLVRFDANYRILSKGTGETRTIALEALAWSADGGG